LLFFLSIKVLRGIVFGCCSEAIAGCSRTFLTKVVVGL
jgi:hypothetical protein